MLYDILDYFFFKVYIDTLMIPVNSLPSIASKDAMRNYQIALQVQGCIASLYTGRQSTL